MTKEELEKEAEEWTKDHSGLIGSYKFVKYDYDSMQKAYLASAEPREKRIAELEQQLSVMEKGTCDVCKVKDAEFYEKRIEELEALIEQLVYFHNGDLETVRILNKQIEKLIDFVLSKTECCDVCPITDTCINSEGTCPYAGILAKGEEVTREWLMQKIAKEIKEND